MDKEECEKVEKGRNAADCLELLIPSLQCLCCDQSRMFGVGCGTRILLVLYTLRRKYLVLKTTRKKICSIAVLSLVQAYKYYRHKGRTQLLVFPLILKERINQGNLRSCRGLFLRWPQTANVSLLSGPKKKKMYFVWHVINWS